MPSSCCCGGLPAGGGEHASVEAALLPSRATRPRFPIRTHIQDKHNSGIVLHLGGERRQHRPLRRLAARIIRGRGAAPAAHHAGPQKEAVLDLGSLALEGWGSGSGPQSACSISVDIASACSHQWWQHTQQRRLSVPAGVAGSRYWDALDARRGRRRGWRQRRRVSQSADKEELERVQYQSRLWPSPSHRRRGQPVRSRSLCPAAKGGMCQRDQR